MSLVITSNVSLNDRPETSNVYKPYSYQNQLLNTMKIPPNSQIALQSCKINKNGLLIVDKSNSGFAHYFGVPLGEATTPDISHSTTQPFFATAGDSGAFDNGARNQRNIDDFANDIQSGISLASFHPAYVNSVLPSKITCNPELSTGNVFEGYEWIATQQTTNTSKSGDLVATDISTNTQGNFTQAGGVITSTTNNGFYVQNREYPVSQNQGSAYFTFSGANASDKDRSPFMCGLSRINRQKDFHGKGMFMPEYFNSGLANGQDTRYGGEQAYADICIARVGTTLKVLQVTSNSRANGNGRGQTQINRVDYTTHNPSGKLGTEYNLRTNTSNYVGCRFEVDNEEVKIYLVNGSGTETLLIDYTMDGSGVTKNTCTNPLGAPKWALYPVCAVGGKGTSGSSLTMSRVDHYTNYPIWNADNYVNYDWWGYSEANGLTRWCREVEMRFWGDKNDTTSGTLGNGLLAPRNVNASGGMDGYKSLIITAQSQEYGEEITAPCNTQQTFGFMGSPISPVALVGLVSTIKSTKTPKLISNVSLFIRLNNFSQNSINARQGTLSKIIAHLPRFDNSGNETGGLYFEPTAGLIYLDLNNTNELLINSFDLDIVYDNETLCTALSGKTIICLHIREKPLR